MEETRHRSALQENKQGRWKRFRLFRNVHPPVAFGVASRKQRKQEEKVFMKSMGTTKHISVASKTYPSVKIIHVQGEDSLSSASDTVPTFISWDSCLQVGEDELTLGSGFDNNHKHNCTPPNPRKILAKDSTDDSLEKQIVVPPFVLRQREQRAERSFAPCDSLASPLQIVGAERRIRGTREQITKRQTSGLQSSSFFCCISVPE